MNHDTDLDALVAESDTGGRQVTGGIGRFIFLTALVWSLFQIWYSSPIPYLIGTGVIPDGKARIVHLAFSLLLTFTTFPAFKRSSRSRIPVTDWILAIVGVASCVYLLFAYNAIAQRAGLPTHLDIMVSVVGVVILLEAARRSVGLALAVIATIMLLYVFAGPYLPGLLAHKGATLARAASQMWLTSEGVFGVALGVSTNVVFMFVLFGALLERAGAGNYFIQLAFSILGRYRGGPAKAGVVASGLTGMISGSSIANVVTTGTFTIPLMKKVGYTSVKAGAIECAAGVNGQIMPPIMGAAAFLIAEYVGIPYAEVVKHAFFPAILTYGSLFYIVDIEAMKMGLKGVPVARAKPLASSLISGLMNICLFIILCGVVYYGIGWIKDVFGTSAKWIISVLIVAAYLWLIAHKAKRPDLPTESSGNSLTELPKFGEVAATGLHYILPVIVLIWCLMVEEMSPGLSGFWGSAALVALILTQKPLTAMFRHQHDIGRQWASGFDDLVEGLVAAARNMTMVGIATAAAGIIVGVVLLTGVGLVMTEIVELVSGGSLTITLLLTALICLILGMGMPTTAAYIVVATLMAPVLVDLAAQNGLTVSLVAVHLFVFYFGLMADVTPPVGLAAYAASAISRADPIQTAIQGFKYEIRTALLPFIFIFNGGMLMIGLDGPLDFVIMAVTSILAMVTFVAATQSWLITKNRWYETIALLLISFTLFRPGYWLDKIESPFDTQQVSTLQAVQHATLDSSQLRLVLATVNLNDQEITKSVLLNLGREGDPAQRLNAAGIGLSELGGEVSVSLVRPGSEASKLHLQVGDKITAILSPTTRPSPNWFMLPALMLLLLIYWRQTVRRRMLLAPRTAPRTSAA